MLLQQQLIADATTQTVTTARDAAAKYATATIPATARTAKDL